MAERVLRDRGRLRAFFARKCEAKLQGVYRALLRGDWTPPTGTRVDMALSMTSWRPKFPGLPLVLISLLQQSARPSEILLWLTEEDRSFLGKEFEERFSQFGVRFLRCDELRCHNKWLHAIESGRKERFVICDDDIIYPRTWLEQLLREDRKDAYVGVRCHEAAVTSAGRFADYADWPKQIRWKESPSERIFLTGCGGTIIHPERIPEPFLQREAIAKYCPQADDVWLFMAHRYAGIPGYKTKYSFPCLELPGTDASGLAASNVAGGGNDEQLRATSEFVESL